MSVPLACGLAACAVWVAGPAAPDSIRRHDPGGGTHRSASGRTHLRPPPLHAGRDPVPAVAAVAVVVTAAVLLGLPGLVGGLVLAGPCAAGVRALRRRSAEGARDPRLPLLLDLVAAGLAAGQPLVGALTLAGDSVGGPSAQALVRVASLLRLGAPPAATWASVADGPLGAVARVAVRSMDSGIRLGQAFMTLADELRARARASAEARAHRVAVLALAPLGLCFLPAFVCLGIVPVIVGVARGVLGTV